MLATKLRVLTEIAQIKGQKPSICTACAGRDKAQIRPRGDRIRTSRGALLVVGIEVDLGGSGWFLDDFFKSFNALL